MFDKRITDYATGSYLALSLDHAYSRTQRKNDTISDGVR